MISRERPNATGIQSQMTSWKKMIEKMAAHYIDSKTPLRRMRKPWISPFPLPSVSPPFPIPGASSPPLRSSSTSLLHAHKSDRSDHIATTSASAQRCLESKTLVSTCKAYHSPPLLHPGNPTTNRCLNFPLHQNPTKLKLTHLQCSKNNTRERTHHGTPAPTSSARHTKHSNHVSKA